MMFIVAGISYANEKSRGLVETGEQLLDEGQFDKALDLFIRAKNADTKDATAWNNAGLTFLLKEKYKESIPFLEKALALSSHCNIYTNLGVAYFKAGNKEKADDTFQDGFEECPDDPLMKQWFDHLNKPAEGKQ